MLPPELQLLLKRLEATPEKRCTLGQECLREELRFLGQSPEFTKAFMDQIVRIRVGPPPDHCNCCGRPFDKE